MTPILDRLLPNRLRRKAQAPTEQAQEPTPPPRPAYRLPAGPPEPIRVRTGPEPKGAVADATKVVTEVTRQKYIARILSVVDIAGKAGVGLFAAALAYSTMFALIPLVLLMAGVLGWLIDDPTQRQQLLAQLIGYFPPLEQFFSAALNGVVAARGVLSVIGLIGLLWGSSNFYAGLDEVMRRIFPGGMVRGPIDRRLRGVITVAGLMGLLVITVLLSSVWAIVNQLVGDLVVWTYIVPLIGLAVFIAVVLIIYLLVPTAPPSFRAAFPPALLAGAGIGLLTNLFGVLAPYLIGSLAAFGVIATAFGVLIWLNFSYQMLLYGAAWARLRRDLEKDRRSVYQG